MRWFGIAMALGLALFVTVDSASAAQRHKSRKPAAKSKKMAARKPTGAESGLLGIKLYDTGEKVITVYGSPDQVEALSGGISFNGGGGGAGGPAGAGGPGGAPPGPMGPGGGPGSGMGRGRGGPRGMAGPRGGDIETDPFEFGDVVLNQAAPMRPGAGASAGPGAASAGPGMGGSPTGPGGPGGMNPGGGIPTGGGGASERVTMTRWVYNRGGSKYGFIIDKSGRVVQIEAIGIDNNQVKTKRGIGFGSTFSTVFTDYAQPDGYEISGDNLMMKYLVHDNVAFRLSRLGPKKPQVVTGIVVAAGKA